MGDLCLLYGTNIKTWELVSPYSMGDIEVSLTIPMNEIALKKLIK